jgi:tetratricopeptide (TPR) repeat protein
MIVNEPQEPQEPQEVHQNPDSQTNPQTDPRTAWLESLRLFQIRKAEAQYRALELLGQRDGLRGEGVPREGVQRDEQVAADLRVLLAWQEAVEAKQYLEAQKYVAQLISPSSQVAGVVDLGALERATQSLQRGEDGKETDPQALRVRLEDALANPFTKAEAHNRLGVLHALLGETDLAKAEFDTVLLERPQHYRALTNLGNLLLEAGDAVAAEEMYRKAIAIAPEYGIAHNNLAVALKKQRKVSAAVRAIKQSTRLERRKFQEEARKNAPGMGGLGKVFGPLFGPIFKSRFVQYFVIVAVLYAAYRLLSHG